MKKASRHYLPAVPWQLYKAQLIQESSLRPNAISPVGAEGLAQFMPGTWSDVSRELGMVGSPTDAELAIPAGAYYMAKLRNIWKWPRPEEDRHNLALACYNAGCGNILKAQRLCGNPSNYEPIMACLPQVTGKHAKETLGYAPRIRRIYKRLVYE
ncbi:transglycosylase SLT domain-containing protein [Vibrio parahaemolyticus]